MSEEGILDLDKLLPADLTIRHLGKEWKIAGDLSVERALRLMKALDDVLAAQKKTKSLLEVGPVLQQTQALILDTLQERHPDLKECPFGISAIPHVLHEILLKLGIITPPPPIPVPDEGDADPPTPPNRATRRAQAKRRGSSTRSRT